ncbi:ribonuclease S-7-like [Arachis stenosperma]|uniref:ribonuclease S-7-like n=1 Tax=Arachis stenosperma TaxID=217475 RepID=UPI0025AB810B|nr:ribonuclease S-7-like [Arachis stenosperma]
MKANIPNYFTIHGLWPQSCAEKPADHFKRSSIDTLQDGFNYYRSSLKSEKTNMELWIEKWEKHGTCSLKKFNQSEYFKQAIFITEFLDILVVFKNVGIIPHRTKTYSRIDIVNAIKKTKTHQVEPELICFQDRSEVLLREIRVYLDANLAEYISCPVNRSKGVILCKTKSNAIKIPV